MTHLDHGPERWAILLTQLLDGVYGNGPGRYPVDVKQLASEYTAQRFPTDPIKRVVGDDLVGCEGALVPSANMPRSWGIIYDAKQRPERARFTIAHEFGHYLLHRDKYPDGFRCGEEVVSRRSGKGVEKEADTFAAYLLMPLHDFRAQIPPDRKPTIDELGTCATRYGVSLMAAILRWLEYTHRRSLFVVSREGFALWAKASDPAYRSGRFIRTRQMLYELPASARCVVGPIDVEARHGVKHPAGVWFDEPVEEVSVSSEELDMVLTILHLGAGGPRDWAAEEDVEDTVDRLASFGRRG